MWIECVLRRGSGESCRQVVQAGWMEQSGWSLSETRDELLLFPLTKTLIFSPSCGLYLKSVSAHHVIRSNTRSSSPLLFFAWLLLTRPILHIPAFPRRADADRPQRLPSSVPSVYPTRQA
jgi:hypothetical protein